jgi:hypothetical protein
MSSSQDANRTPAEPQLKAHAHAHAQAQAQIAKDVKRRLVAVCLERDALRLELSATQEALETEREKTGALLETLRLERRTSPRVFQDIAHIEFLKERLEQYQALVIKMEASK